MTDLEKLIVAFTEIGVKHKVVENEGDGREVGINKRWVGQAGGRWEYDDALSKTDVILEAGSGYTGFETWFYFNKDGKFLDHAVFE